MARRHRSVPTPSPVRRRRRLSGPAVLASLALAAVGLPVTSGAAASAATASVPVLTAPAAAPTTVTPVRRDRSVIANLWEWNWPSIARECTRVLGPKGYGGVQVAPPQDSLRRTETGNGSDVLHPWWEVYQPARYVLTSRMGGPRQFRHMVDTCRAAGVKVYVDAVINHMTGQGHLSYGGVTYDKYRYRGLYRPSAFHSYPIECPVPPAEGSGSRAGDILDFNDYTQVHNCELVSLSDLRTETRYVRDQLADYLNKLLRIGVSGFRVDAAKHMSKPDLLGIRSRLRDTVDGDRPYLALEVGPGSPGRLSPLAYRRVGDLLGFDFATAIKNAFKSYNSPPNDGNIGDLKVFGERSGLLPSRRTLVFIQNHDTERGADTLNYKDGATNRIAHHFMLAYGYGRPQVYASFDWEATDASPPANARGFITDTDCGDGWICVDRNRGVANMVGFHNEVGRAPRAHWYDDGANLIAFGRGHRGWIAINNHTGERTRTLQTGLRAGTYCDIIHGNVRDGDCTGPTVTVRANGRATVTVPGKDSVAFTRQDRVGR